MYLPMTNCGTIVRPLLMDVMQLSKIQLSNTAYIPRIYYSKISDLYKILPSPSLSEAII